MKSPFNLISKKLKSNWLVELFFQPKLYLFTILKNLIFIACFSLALSYYYFNSEYSTIKIPTITHTLISVAMGLLLVFRTQSAYERWTTASQNFYNIKASFFLMGFTIKNSIGDRDKIHSLKLMISDFTKNFTEFLKDDDSDNSSVLEKKFLENLRSIYGFIEVNIQDSSDRGLLFRIFNDIMQNASSCVRIKETPIPKSYEMHIKISIFLYILSLPFGLFYDMGLWSILMVVVVYYIIAGIEIISREIENPFEGAPNDLPISKYVTKINGCLD